MAVIETWLKQDLQELVHVKCLTGNLFSLDNGGNLIGVEVTDNGEPATLAGTVTANAILADGSTVAISNGVLDGNKVSVVLPQACYAVLGNITIAIKLSYSGTVTTLGCVIGVVYRSSTDTPVDPGTIIPSIQDLITQIQTAVGSIPADYSALWTTLAPAYTQKTYAVGEYRTNGGVMYRCKTDITQAEEFTDSHWTAVNIGGELTDITNNLNLVKRCVGDSAGIYIAADEWENGSITSSTGVNTTSGAQIRTKYYYPISSFGQLYFTGVGTSDRVEFGYFYDENFAFIDRFGISANSTTIPYNAAFVRFTYGFTSGSGTSISSYGFDNTIADWGIKYNSPLREDAEGMTGLKPIILTPGYYVNIGTNTSIDLSTAITAYEPYGYAIIDVTEGDVFTINATSGTGARAFAFIDSEGNILLKATASVTINDRILVAPKNSAKLIVNAVRADRNSYYGATLNKNINRTRTAIETYNDINEKFNKTVKPALTFEQGAINSSTGANYTSSSASYNRRVRTAGAISNVKNAYLHVQFPPEYWFYIMTYNGTVDTTGFVETLSIDGTTALNGEYNILIKTDYFRFTIQRYDSGEDISPSDVPLDDITVEFIVPSDSGYLLATNDLTNNLNGCINYNYDVPYHQEANPDGSSAWAKLGIDRRGPVITINRATTESSIRRIKLDGNITGATTNSGVDNLTATLSLVPGHRYVGTMKILEGSCIYNSGDTDNYVPSLVFTKGGTHVGVGTGVRIENNTTFKRNFVAENSLYNVLIWMEADHYILNDAKFMVTLQDLDADIPAANVPESLIADKDELTATANHSAGDVFICQNQLLRATDAIASGESIVIGTSGNAEAITLADYIKEIVTNASGIRADLDTLSSFGTDPDMALTKNIYRWNGPARVYSGRTLSTTNGVIHIVANPSAGQRGFWCTNLNNGTSASNLSNSVPPATALEPISKLENADLMRVRFDQTSGDSVMTIYVALYYCTLNGDTVTVIGMDRIGLPHGVNHCVRLNVPDTATHYAFMVYESTAVAGEMDIYVKFTVSTTDIP